MLKNSGLLIQHSDSTLLHPWIHTFIHTQSSSRVHSPLQETSHYSTAISDSVLQRKRARLAKHININLHREISSMESRRLRRISQEPDLSITAPNSLSLRFYACLRDDRGAQFSYTFALMSGNYVSRRLGS